jgi:hypothetical protein
MQVNIHDCRDKVLGCWLGKNIGGTLGAPFECKRGVFPVEFYTQDTHGEPLPNDDLDLQLVWLNAVANTGGGGGGGAEAPSGAEPWGGRGGSGIVIVRYVTGGGVAPFEAWRQTYFTAEQLTNAAISSATADPDEDGLNNEQEYLAGTNPTNALSCLVISAATNNPATSGKFVLSWQSVSSKMYTVMAATNLMTGFTDLATNIQATPTVNVHTDSVENAGQRFYRIKLE